MSNLLTTIQEIAHNVYQANTPTDLTIGTVTSVNPLAITLDYNMLTLPTAVLLLTETVVEKKIDLHHTHQYPHTHSGTDSHGDSFTTSSQSTSTTDSGTLCNNAFTSAPSFPDYGTDGSARIVTPGLRVGDKVLLLRVMSGQQFVVLSRVVEAK